MFLIDLVYVKSIDDVMGALDAHNEFLNKYYSQGLFLFSGPKKPRVGGMIVCTAKSKEEVEDLIKEDPFYKEGIADYKITEVEPSKWVDVLEPYIKK